MSKKEYEMRIISRLPYFKILAKELVERFHPSIVLDIGCADGLLVQAFRELGVNAIGVDISHEALLISEEKSSLVLSDARTGLPFKDEIFDMVTILEVLEHLHLKEIDDVISEVNRVLRPNGIVLITTPTPLEQTIRKILGNADNSHITIKTKKFWVEKFKLKGFSQMEEFEEIYYNIVVKFIKNMNEFSFRVVKYLDKVGIFKYLLHFWKNAILFKKLKNL